MTDEDQTDAPEMRANVLKQRKTTAASRADHGATNLAAGGGNPLSAALGVLADGAWVSPSTERTNFAENLEGAGLAVTKAFESQGDSCRSEASAEPAEVDLDDDAESWKASGAQIDARASAASHYPGGH